jgi:hypothetical protein
MAELCVVSAHEKSFILGGVAADMRSDGRARNDFRAFALEFGVVSNANGSARLRLERTDVMVCPRVLLFLMMRACFACYIDRANTGIGRSQSRNHAM